MRKAQNEEKRLSSLMVQQNTSEGKDFQLERYKYILSEIRSLNENIHKYLSLFQTLATAIISGAISILVLWKSLRIDPNTARIAINGILILLVILDLFITLSIVSSIFSWLDYRKEEVELLEKISVLGLRKLPTLRNFWRWSEIYVLLFINLVTIVVFFYVEYQIIPVVK